MDRTEYRDFTTAAAGDIRRLQDSADSDIEALTDALMDGCMIGMVLDHQEQTVSAGDAFIGANRARLREPRNVALSAVTRPAAGSMAWIAVVVSYTTESTGTLEDPDGTIYERYLDDGADIEILRGVDATENPVRPDIPEGALVVGEILLRPVTTPLSAHTVDISRRSKCLPDRICDEIQAEREGRKIQVDAIWAELNRPKSDRPGDPAAPTLTSPSNLRITIRWVPPEENNEEIDRYEVQWRKADEDWSAIRTRSVTTTVASVTVDDNDENVLAHVRAHNALGWSEWGDEGSIAANRIVKTVVPPPPDTAPVAPPAPSLASLAAGMVTAIWSAPNNGGQPITAYGVRWRQKGDAGWKATISISGRGFGTTTTFAVPDAEKDIEVQVQATNSIGASAWGATGTLPKASIMPPNTAPEAPPAPTLVSRQELVVSATWVAPNTGGSAITAYGVRWRQKGDAQWKPTINLSGKTLTVSAVFRVPDASKDVEVQVNATNAIGTSAWGTTGTIAAAKITPAPDPDTAPDAPSAPTLHSVAALQVSVVWSAPNDGGQPITGYGVRWRQKGDAGWSATISTGPTITSAVFVVPDASKDVEVQVQASNRLGASAWGTTGTITAAKITPAPDPDTAPDAPTEPAMTSSAALMVTAAWSTPDDGGDPISSYGVRWRQKGDTSWSATITLSGQSLATSTTFSVPDNTKDVEAQVQATNSIGTSAWSGTGTITAAKITPTAPPADPDETTAPDAPARPVVISQHPLQIRALWRANSNGGSAITAYGVRWRQKGGNWSETINLSGEALLNQTRFNVPDNSKDIEVEVNASNIIGTSAWSLTGSLAARRIVPPPPDVTAPNAPSAPSLTSPSALRVRASWAAPANNGAAITGYGVRWRQKGDTFKTISTTGTVASFVVPDRTKDVEVQVRATNSEGTSAYGALATIASNRITAPAAVARVPDAPAAPVLTSQAALSVRAIWGAPANNGASITGYGVRWRQKGDQSWSATIDTGANRTTTFPVPDASNDIEVQVNARNRIGTSAWGTTGTIAASKITPPAPTASAPDAPSAPSLSSPSHLKVTATWTAPNNNGAAITGYRVRWRKKGEASRTLVSSSTTATFSVNDNNKDVEVEVQATNSAGTSAYGATGTIAANRILKTVAPVADTKPDAPAAPTLTSAAELMVTAAWSAPNNGGQPITGYGVRWRQKGDTDWSATITLSGNSLARTTTFAVPDATADVEAQVQATNAIGTSAWGATGTITAAKIMAPAPLGRPATPAAPTITSRPTLRVRLQWTVPADGGTAITAGELRWRQDGDEWSAGRTRLSTAWKRGVISASFTVPDASKNIEAQVRHRNAVGWSDWSPVATLAKGDIATAPSLRTHTYSTAGAHSLTWPYPQASKLKLTMVGGSGGTGEDGTDGEKGGDATQGSRVQWSYQWSGINPEGVRQSGQATGSATEAIAEESVASIARTLRSQGWTSVQTSTSSSRVNTAINGAPGEPGDSGDNGEDGEDTTVKIGSTTYRATGGNGGDGGDGGIGGAGGQAPNGKGQPGGPGGDGAPGDTGQTRVVTVGGITAGTTISIVVGDGGDGEGGNPDGSAGSVTIEPIAS